MAGVIFSGIDPATDVSTGLCGQDRADSPDSGQGTDTSSTRGSQSPVETQSQHHIYKISRSSPSDTRTDNRKTKSTLLSYKDVSCARDRSRSQDRTGRPLTETTPINKVNSNNKAKLPPRPPRTSSSLPPPVPKKQRDTRLDTSRQQRSSSLIKREVLPPERKSIHGRTLPLQIQSPSIVQALRAAGSSNISETKARSNLNVKHQNSQANAAIKSVKTSNNVPQNKSKRNNNDQNALNEPEKSPTKFPTKVTPRDASNRSKEPIKAWSSGSKVTRTVSTSQPQVRKSPSNENSQKHKLANESLASRAKRTTEDKVKKIYNTLKSPKQDRKLNYSDRRKNLQRGEMLINTNADRGEFPKQPVQSLIKLYDKSKVKTYKYGEHKLIQGNNNNLSSKPNSSTKATVAPAATRAKFNQKNSNVVNKSKADDGKFGQHQEKIPTGSERGTRVSPSRSQVSSPTKEIKTSPPKPNSIDEFLQSAKRTRQKYQNMLNNDVDKRVENDNLEVKTDPSELDLQTGCFTDVTYAGYFAKTTTENDQNGNDVSICGNISNLDEDQNKLCKQPSYYQEASTAALAAAENNNEKHLDDIFNNKDVNEHVKKIPTPSPRLKKKQRREQMLQEHKQLGKTVLAIAKNNFEPDQSSHDNSQVNIQILISSFKYLFIYFVLGNT